jgi:hypothetical protein
MAILCARPAASVLTTRRVGSIAIEATMDARSVMGKKPNRDADRDVSNMKIQKWITYEEAEGREENGLGGMGGWFGYDKVNRDAEGRRTMVGHRWQDYLDHFKPEAHQLLEELYRSIVANEIRCTGEEH